MGETRGSHRNPMWRLSIYISFSLSASQLRAHVLLQSSTHESTELSPCHLTSLVPHLEHQLLLSVQLLHWVTWIAWYENTEGLQKLTPIYINIWQKYLRSIELHILLRLSGRLRASSPHQDALGQNSFSKNTGAWLHPDTSKGEAKSDSINPLQNFKDKSMTEVHMEQT